MSQAKRKKFSCKFKNDWVEKYGNEIRRIPSNIYAFFCVICDKAVSCEHMGESDVTRHTQSAMHRKNKQARKESHNLKQVSVRKMVHSDNELSLHEFKVRRAEVKFSMFIAEHHIPIAVMDHLSPLVAQCFPDSKIASSFASRRTKTSCIISDAVAPSLLQTVTDKLKSKPFSLSVDGSNDSGLKKMNPVAVKYFDVQQQKVVFNLLDMCTTSGENAATAESITLAINGVIEKHCLSWTNVVAISMDNTSVNFGRRSGILTRLQREFCPHLYGMGCPCHIIHNTAEQGYKAFSKSSGFDVEDLAVDLCYWFDKSTKRKAELESYSQFCDVQYRQVLDFCSTRWLCMQAVIHRVIDMYEPLRSYFSSASQEDKSRFERLKSTFADPMTIIYLHFYNHALPVFDNLNLLLQRQDPQIHRLQPCMQAFIKKCLLRIIDPTQICSMDVWTCNTASLSLLPDDEVNIGSLADEGLQALLESGDISDQKKSKFISAVKTFWTTVHKYATAKLPYKDDLLENCQWIDYFRRGESKFAQVKYFLNHFPYIS